MTDTWADQWAAREARDEKILRAIYAAMRRAGVGGSLAEKFESALLSAVNGLLDEREVPT